MTRTGPIAAALRVLGRRGRSTSAPDTSVQILAQLVKDGRITVGEAKFSQGSMLEIKVPRNETPRRIYWDADTVCYSYPLGKVNVRYYLTEKEKKEMLKKGSMKDDGGGKEKLADIVVGASAVELLFKLVSELGSIVSDPLSRAVNIFKKPNTDNKIKDLKEEFGKMSRDVNSTVSTEMGKFTAIFDELRRLSNDMATVERHLGVKSDSEQEETKGEGGKESVEAEKKKNGKRDNGEKTVKDEGTDDEAATDGDSE